MGMELALRFSAPDLTAVAAVLRGLPSARELAPAWSGVELRTDATSGGMPDATVKAESYGTYFCDHGGHGREFLGIVEARLVSGFGQVTVEELE
jgi:hypothetical protein